VISWLVQSNLLDYRQISMVCDAVRASGATVLEAQVIPFQDEIGNPEVLEGVEGIVIPYGSTKLTKIAMAKGWKGSFFDPLLFRTDAWDAVHSDRLLNEDQMIMTVAEVPSKIGHWHPDGKVFIRPRDDLKAFNGTVTTVKEVMNWMRSTDSGNFSFDENTVVMISSVKELKEECRWFIVGGKVINGSRYRHFGQLVSSEIHDDDPRVKVAQRLADIWLPHETVVMDTAMTAKGMKIIEYNCFNSSGFYQHDIRKIVQAVTEYSKGLI
jgi:hypothetical protein